MMAVDRRYMWEWVNYIYIHVYVYVCVCVCVCVRARARVICLERTVYHDADVVTKSYG